MGRLYVRLPFVRKSGFQKQVKTAKESDLRAAKSGFLNRPNVWLCSFLV